MNNETVVVFTGKSITMIINETGSSSWRLNRNRAAKCQYVVCTRNQNVPEEWGWPEGEGKHHHAFLVGKIADIVRSPERDEDDRFLIKIDEYA
ncbi:MAG: hypothetical protein AB8G22_14020, partial [Saprospiraceae bacterium]